MEKDEKDQKRESLQKSRASHIRWSRTPDREAAMTPARQGFMAKFAKEVDPDGSLPPDVRAKLAEAAMKAHMGALSLKARERRQAS